MKSKRPCLFETNELQVIFESFSVPAMYLAQQAVLTLSLGLFFVRGFQNIRWPGGGGRQGPALKCFFKKDRVSFGSAVVAGGSAV